MADGRTWLVVTDQGQRATCRTPEAVVAMLTVTGAAVYRVTVVDVHGRPLVGSVPPTTTEGDDRG